MNKKYLPQLVVLTSAILIFALVLGYVGFAGRTQVKGTGSLKVVMIAPLQLSSATAKVYLASITDIGAPFSFSIPIEEENGSGSKTIKSLAVGEYVLKVESPPETEITSILARSEGGLPYEGDPDKTTDIKISSGKETIVAVYFQRPKPPKKFTCEEIPGQKCRKKPPGCNADEGPGSGSCPDGQRCCKGPTHLECDAVSLKCLSKSGGGDNKDGCITGGAPCPQTHLECKSATKQCIKVKGAGDNKNGCTSVGEKCFHLECNQKTKVCASVIGVGEDKDDCKAQGAKCEPVSKYKCFSTANGGQCALDKYGNYSNYFACMEDCIKQFPPPDLTPNPDPPS